jgi:hypothetical protein
VKQFINWLLFFLVVATFLGQDTPPRPVPSQKRKTGRAKVTVEGFVHLDGKPLGDSTIVIRTSTTHLENSDWWLPIITSRSVGIIAETGTPTYERPDFYTYTKTDKSGHFRQSLPRGKTLLVYVTAATPGKQWTQTVRDAPCGHSVITTVAAGDTIRYDLDSGRTPVKGGCIKLP